MIRLPFVGLGTIHDVDVPAPTGTSLTPVAGMQWVDWNGDGSLIVVDIGLACCALEFEAAAAGTRWSPVPPGWWESWSPDSPKVPDGQMVPDAQIVIVVSGTVTDRLAPAVLAMVDAARQQAKSPPYVISFGACASSGGPYWDSYAVTKGVDQLLPVDLFLPGCPPPPDALRQALSTLADPSPIAPFSRRVGQESTDR